MSPRTVRPVVRLSVLALGLLAGGVALADAHLDPALLERLAQVAASEPLEVVVTYGQDGPVTAAQRSVLAQLGIETGVTMSTLPVAGVIATPGMIDALSARDDVASIYLNQRLTYFNKEAREISGAARAVDRPADFVRAIPFSGAGVAVMVNDSGIDATHMDLKFGEHVVENVQALTNLAALSSLLPVSYLEGQPNTDISSGHGTHCAGSVGGTGARSGGQYRGVAPGASLVGYGSGAVITILDAVGGIDYAITNQFSFDDPIRVISNSWGSSGAFDPENPVNVASYEAYKRGIVSVFAAGNSGPAEDTHNPYAQAPWVISVGAGEKNGLLTGFSSRGNPGESGTFTMPDGEEWTYYNEPTVVAAGVDIVSTRTLTGALPVLALPDDAALIPPAQLPFYTVMSGTSMATPHVAGIVALMLEANPDLTPSEVKDILERTATNISGRLPWEVGAGYVNAYAAVAEASRVREGYGQTVNLLREFNANALLLPADAPLPFSVFFSPVGPVEEHSFEVGDDVAFVNASASVGDNTIALVLTDPDGERYGSAISLPLLGSEVAVGAPGKPGTWTITARGIGSVSGLPLDPGGVTNGYGVPGTIAGDISLVRSAGYTGLADISAHPARQAIEYAVSHRLVDGYANGRFLPDQDLRRGELAQYLVMGASVRQSLPFGQPSFADVSVASSIYPYAESAIATGAPLRDPGHTQAGPMRLVNGRFDPYGPVSRLDLAYALVQSLGLQAEAEAATSALTVYHMGERIPVQDSASIPAGLRGYAQYALDLGLINARFVVVQGPFDLQPTLKAYFDPNLRVTRAFYAVSAGRYLTQYRTIGG